MANDSEEAREQAIQLASDLSIKNKPALLRTLNCAGLVQDAGERKRFGFLFNLPHWVDVSRQLTTLHSYLSGKSNGATHMGRPTLGERFELARDLAYSVAELHGANILHKNLHSGNIFFFPERFNKPPRVSRPFLGGFEVSRPDQNGQLSLDLSRKQFKSYQHPDFYDPSNKMQGKPSSHRKYDIYSLGLILLEIGLWTPIANLEQEGKNHEENAKRFLQHASRQLSHYMGSHFSEAVMECLDSKSEIMAQKPESQQDLHLTNDSRELFIRNVIYRLETCCSWL